MSKEQRRPRAGRVTVQNVNHPGSTSSVDAAMYGAMRTVMLEVLPTSAPGLTLAQLRSAILPRLPGDLFPAGARVSWWSKTVQLDLEAKGLIARESTSPLRLHRT